MSDFQVRVRDACDRCHQKKLKCERDRRHQGKLKCERCRQSGMSCSFSPRTPYNTSRRSRKSGQEDRRSSLEVDSSIEPPSPAAGATEPGYSFVEWNISDMGICRAQMDNLNALSPVDLCAQIAPNDNGGFWGSLEEFGSDYTLAPASEKSSATGNVLYHSGIRPSQSTYSDSGTSMTSLGNNRSSFGCRQREGKHRFVDLGGKIFEPRETKGTSEPHSNDSISVGQLLPHADLYCQLFELTHSLNLAVEPYTNNLPASNTKQATSQTDESELLFILSCYLNLLSRFDSVFSYWLPLVYPGEEKAQKDHVRAGIIRDTIMRIIPPSTVPHIFASTIYFSQLRLILEISSKGYHELSSSLDHLTTKVTGRGGPDNAGTVGHIAQTTFELVIGRERMIRAKRDKLMGLIEDGAVRADLEKCLSLLNTEST